MKRWIIGIIISILLILGVLLCFGKYEILLGILVILLPIGDISILIGLGALFYFVGKKIGGDKARREINKEIKKLNIDNPYIYFREIPNKYGVGVSLSLLNYKVSKEDVLACVLDLCAKGYIKFKQNGKNYEIVDNNRDISMLLKNELYILNWVLNNNSLKINLKEWKKLCNSDAIDLGFADKGEENKYKPLFEMGPKYAKNLLFVSYAFSIVLIRFFDIFIERSIGFFETIFMALFLTGPVWFIVFLIMLFVALLYEGKILNYNAKKNNMIVLTELGKNEYYELCSLGKFLDDFGNFIDKHVGEIVIWEQYLSYALIFRLGKKIINTGYDKLRINDSFIIDDLDKIVL